MFSLTLAMLAKLNSTSTNLVFRKLHVDIIINALRSWGSDRVTFIVIGKNVIHKISVKVNLSKKVKLFNQRICVRFLFHPIIIVAFLPPSFRFKGGACGPMADVL